MDVTVSADMSRSHHARDRRILRAVELIDCGVVMIDGQARIDLVNREFCRIFDIPEPPEFWVGRRAEELIDIVAGVMADPASYRDGVEQLRTLDGERTDDLLARDGRVIERNSLTITEAGVETGRVTFYWEVTTERRADAARDRRQRAEIAAQRLGVHAQRQRALEAEHKAGQRKEALATASHELRTPLIAILSFSEMLGNLDPGADTTAQRTAQYTEIINRNARSLINVVDDLLQVTRTETELAPLDLETMDLAEVLAHTVDDLRPALDDAGVVLAIEVATGLFVRGDRNAVSRALSNVVSNAIKYSDKGGRITLLASTDDTTVTVVVADEGIGIPADEVEHVFGPFFRASTARRSDRTGTGLGLSIVRGIVHQHGGSVALRSEVGAGTRVILTLPSAPA